MPQWQRHASRDTEMYRCRLSADLLDVPRWALIDAFPMARLASANPTRGQSGIGAQAYWTDAQFIQTMHTGVTPEGRKLDGRYMPWQASAPLATTSCGVVDGSRAEAGGMARRRYQP
jgi:hypothetical protein